MRIDIWSDVVCPWCYIGKRRLETALSTFEHADQVDVVWHSFQLDPGAPTEPTESTGVMLARKYGQSPDGARQMQDQVEGVAAQDGLVFRLADTLHLSTLDAHRLLHLALHDGGPLLQGRVKEALLAAYFVDARNIADRDELRAIATGAGLDAGHVDRVLGSEQYADEVWADIAQAQSLGATGVPLVVVDGRFGVSGAQPAETFVEMLEQAWSQAHPTNERVTGPTGPATVPAAAAGDACGPDGCAI